MSLAVLTSTYNLCFEQIQEKNDHKFKIIAYKYCNFPVLKIAIVLRRRIM